MARRAIVTPVDVAETTASTAEKFLGWAAANTLSLPEAGIEIPVAEIYDDVAFGDEVSGG